MLPSIYHRLLKDVPISKCLCRLPNFKWRTNWYHCSKWKIFIFHCTDSPEKSKAGFRSNILVTCVGIRTAKQANNVAAMLPIIKDIVTTLFSWLGLYECSCKHKCLPRCISHRFCFASSCSPAMSCKFTFYLLFYYIFPCTYMINIVYRMLFMGLVNFLTLSWLCICTVYIIMECIQKTLIALLDFPIWRLWGSIKGGVHICRVAYDIKVS